MRAGLDCTEIRAHTEEEKTANMQKLLCDSHPDVENGMKNTRLLEVVERVLNIILGKDRCYIVGALEPHYIKIITKKDNKTEEILSIKHLSSGQCALLSVFATILRYSCNIKSPNVPIDHNDISGICIIDEIDAHLHSDLQYDVVPELIKLFPKIQFIISTHSPLFVLGMEKKFGQVGIQLIEMPECQEVKVERFREFEKSYEYYKNTKKFEESLENELSSKDVILFVEGDTDKEILKNAWSKIKETEEKKFGIVPLYGVSRISLYFSMTITMCSKKAQRSSLYVC